MMEDDFVGIDGEMIQENSLHALIDGDIICHSVASAADGKYYRVLDGCKRPTFKKAADAEIYLQNLGLSTLWRETIYLPDPVENCLHSVKLMVKSILEGCSTNVYTIFISGTDNFRYRVSETYKANRREIHRAYHLEACKQYLIDRFNAIVVHGVEADDAMGITQCTSKPLTTIIATIDKDLDMIPGLHFRWSCGGSEPRIYQQDSLSAVRCFMKQLITGDKTDNIEGLSEKSPSKRTYLTDKIDELSTVQEMSDYVVSGYFLKYKSLDKARKMLDRESALLWILRDCKEIVVESPNHRRYLI